MPSSQPQRPVWGLRLGFKVQDPIWFRFKPHSFRCDVWVCTLDRWQFDGCLSVRPQFPTNGSNQIHIPALSVDGLSTPVVLSPGPQKPWPPHLPYTACPWAYNSTPWRWWMVWLLKPSSGNQQSSNFQLLTIRKTLAAGQVLQSAGCWRHHSLI